MSQFKDLIKSLSSTKRTKKEGNYKQEEVVYVNPDSQNGVPDNTQLMHLNEAGLLQNIKFRFLKDQIYSYVAAILIAVNPYKRLSIYSESTMADYTGKSIGILPPHVFAIADRAFRAMKTGERNQSVVVSGESGSGKTETSKYVMRYLINVGQGSSDHTLEQKIIEVNPILEAFGNAKTLMNNNSSRFGKFTVIHFNRSHQVAGASIETYLLEKSRVVRQQPNERNYHIFYFFVKGAPAEEKAKFGLKKVEDFHYLNQSGCMEIPDVSDAEEYRVVRKAMELLGLTAEDQNNIFRIIAGILHLGNVKIAEKNRGEQSSVKNPEVLELIATNLGCSKDELDKNLTTRLMKSQRGSMYTIPFKPAEAEDARDALGKMIYSRLFDWLVTKINASLAMVDESNAHCGILDIFGFETFEINSFEQLCINHANEKLQQYFIQQVLVQEQEIYAREGITCGKIQFADNQEVIDLIEAKGVGMFYILDDECKIAKSTAKSFAEKVFRGHTSNSRLYSARKAKKKNRFNDDEAFCIRHFAGEVIYVTEGFLEKNKDSLPLGLTRLMFSCENNSVCMQLFEEDRQAEEEANRQAKSGGKGGAPSGGRFNSISRKFMTQLVELMTNLNATDSSFIRCIKPNIEKKPGIYQGTHVMNQLRCLGMVETLMLMHTGFPTRCPYDHIYSSYATIVPDFVRNLPAAEFVEAIMMALEVPRSKFQLGITRVFFKSGMLAFLDELLDSSADKMAGLANKIRHWILKKRWRKATKTVVCFLRFSDKLRRLRALKELLKSTKIIFRLQMGLFRMLKRIRRRKAASIIQKIWRGHRQASKWRKTSKAIVVIQKVYRRYRVQKEFKAEIERRRKEIQKQLAEKRKAEQERKEAEVREKIRQERERKEKERKEKEEFDRLERERLRLETEERIRREREDMERAREERERLEKERREREEEERRQREEERQRREEERRQREEQARRDREDEERRKREDREREIREERERREREDQERRDREKMMFEMEKEKMKQQMELQMEQMRMQQQLQQAQLQAQMMAAQQQVQMAPPPVAAYPNYPPPVVYEEEEEEEEEEEQATENGVQAEGAEGGQKPKKAKKKVRRAAMGPMPGGGIPYVLIPENAIGGGIREMSKNIKALNSRMQKEEEERKKLYANMSMMIQNMNVLLRYSDSSRLTEKLREAIEEQEEEKKEQKTEDGEEKPEGESEDNEEKERKKEELKRFNFPLPVPEIDEMNFSDDQIDQMKQLATEDYSDLYSIPETVGNIVESCQSALKSLLVKLGQQEEETSQMKRELFAAMVVSYKLEMEVYGEPVMLDTDELWEEVCAKNLDRRYWNQFITEHCVEMGAP